MQAAIEVAKLQDSQVNEAGALLARAFFDDPLMTYALPDEAHRRRALTPLMTVGVRLGQPGGEVYANNGPMQGVAVWSAPGQGEFTPEALAAAGDAQTMQEMGADAAARFNTALGTFGALHQRDMPAPHWYLMLLGVDPPRQGMGVGSCLITPVLERADAAGVCCYLETLKPRNVTFYRKHGFEVVVEDALPSGPRYWTMRRDPR